MPQGLQVWDASGNLVIDTSTYVLKTGFISLGNVTTAGSYDITPLVTVGIDVIPIVQNNDAELPLPKVTKSSSAIEWAAQSGGAASDGFNARIKVMLV